MDKALTLLKSPDLGMGTSVEDIFVLCMWRKRALQRNGGCPALMERGPNCDRALKAPLLPSGQAVSVGKLPAGSLDQGDELRLESHSQKRRNGEMEERPGVRG